MSRRVAYLNGEFIPETEARVSVFDCALMFGDMIFEMSRSYGQKPFLMREHLERLYSSLRYVQIDCGMTIDELEKATHDLIERNLPALNGVEYMVMHDITRGGIPVYSDVIKEGTDPVVIITTFPLVRHIGAMLEKFENGASFVVTRQQSVPSRFIDPKAKNRSRLYYKLADLEAERAEAGAMALLTDEQGFITEGTGSNFFIVRDGEILTPAPHNILRGVSRQYCIELAARLGIPLKETSIEPYDVANADEAWFATTPFGMVPVTRFDFNPIADGRPGPVFGRLIEAWSKSVGVDIIGQSREYAELMKTWKP